MVIDFSSQPTKVERGLRPHFVLIWLARRIDCRSRISSMNQLCIQDRLHRLNSRFWRAVNPMMVFV